MIEEQQLLGTPCDAPAHRLWINMPLREAETARDARRIVRREFGGSARSLALAGDGTQIAVLRHGRDRRYLPLVALLSHASRRKGKTLVVLQSFLVGEDNEEGTPPRVLHLFVRAEDGHIDGGHEIVVPQEERGGLLQGAAASSLIPGSSGADGDAEVYGDLARATVPGAKPLSELLDLYQDYAPEWQRVRPVSLTALALGVGGTLVLGIGAYLMWSGYEKRQAVEAAKVAAREAARANYQQAVEEVRGMPTPAWLADNALELAARWVTVAPEWSMVGLRCDAAQCELRWDHPAGLSVDEFLSATGFGLADVALLAEDQVVAGGESGQRPATLNNEEDLVVRHRTTPPLPPEVPAPGALQLGEYWGLVSYCQTLERYEVSCRVEGPSTPPAVAAGADHAGGSRFMRGRWKMSGAADTFRPVMAEVSGAGWIKGDLVSLLFSASGTYSWTMEGEYVVQE